MIRGLNRLHLIHANVPVISYSIHLILIHPADTPSTSTKGYFKFISFSSTCFFVRPGFFHFRSFNGPPQTCLGSYLFSHPSGPLLVLVSLTTVPSWCRGSWLTRLFLSPCRNTLKHINITGHSLLPGDCRNEWILTWQGGGGGREKREVWREEVEDEQEQPREGKNEALRTRKAMPWEQQDAAENRTNESTSSSGSDCPPPGSNSSCCECSVQFCMAGCGALCEPRPRSCEARNVRLQLNSNLSSSKRPCMYEVFWCELRSRSGEARNERLQPNSQLILVLMFPLWVRSSVWCYCWGQEATIHHTLSPHSSSSFFRVVHGHVGA